MYNSIVTQIFEDKCICENLLRIHSSIYYISSSLTPTPYHPVPNHYPTSAFPSELHIFSADSIGMIC